MRSALAGPGILRRPPVPSIEARVRGARHSQPRDGEAVRHHYDLSNDFYRLVLGPSMVYSCAYFEHPAIPRARPGAQARSDLPQAELGPGQRLLDVGCGWGSLVLHAARHYGPRWSGSRCRATGRFARERADSGSATRSRFEVADYRELTGEPFDKIASVGMFEHVGQAQLTRHFDRSPATAGPAACCSTTGSAGWRRTRPGPTSSSRATSSPTASCCRSPK